MKKFVFIAKLDSGIIIILSISNYNVIDHSYCLIIYLNNFNYNLGPYIFGIEIKFPIR